MKIIKIISFTFLAVCLFATTGCKKKTPPVVSTVSVSDVTGTTATMNGFVDSKTAVGTAGFCWDTSPEPNLSVAYTKEGFSGKTFKSTLTNLKPNTTYYIRAYATNEKGTSYGNQMSFTTSNAWVKANSLPQGKTITQLTTIGNRIFGLSNYNIVSPSDNGASWNPVLIQGNPQIFAFHSFNDALYASTQYTLYQSPDNGNNWTTAYKYQILNMFTAMASKSNTLMTANNDGIYSSIDNAKSWRYCNAGLSPNDMGISFLICNGESFYAQGRNGTHYRSKNNGTSWTVINSGLGTSLFNAAGVSGKRLFVNTSTGVYSIEEGSDTWLKTDAVFNGLPVAAFATQDDVIYAATQKGVFRLTGSATIWEPILREGLPADLSPTGLAVSDSLLILTATGGNTYQLRM